MTTREIAVFALRWDVRYWEGVIVRLTDPLERTMAWMERERVIRKLERMGEKQWPNSPAYALMREASWLRYLATREEA